ncbi:hypothetical protein JKF63_02512 [Porcisia hertigi]|uniref:Uncharacterized protein n=1 Tax=Porcisia hertigi TaxID=2761500 RepID=A0A836IF45_9TRYP|nr:hypothetical protein JKF63_02512 [Porcisia hertigi]
MEAPRPAVGDGLVTLPADELRVSLQHILGALRFFSDICSKERRVLEDQRQHILVLLSKLEKRDIPSHSPPWTGWRRQTLLSPASAISEDSHDESFFVPVHHREPPDARSSAAEDSTHLSVAEVGDLHPTTRSHPVDRCLLASLFSQASPNSVTPPQSSSCPCVRHPNARLTDVDEERVDRPDSEKCSGQYPEATVPRKTPRLATSSPHSLSPRPFTARTGLEGHYYSPKGSQRCPEAEGALKPRGPWHRGPSRRTTNQQSHRCTADLTGRRSFWINVWPCFGDTAVARAQHPIRVLVQGRYHYFEDVLEKAAKLTDCKPASHCFYTPDGCPIRDVKDLVSENHYLLFPSGGLYRKHSIPTALLWLLYTDARHIVESSYVKKSLRAKDVMVDASTSQYA